MSPHASWSRVMSQRTSSSGIARWTGCSPPGSANAPAMCWSPSESTGARCGELQMRQVVRVVRLVRGGVAMRPRSLAREQVVGRCREQVAEPRYGGNRSGLLARLEPVAVAVHRVDQVQPAVRDPMGGLGGDPLETLDADAGLLDLKEIGDLLLRLAAAT